MNADRYIPQGEGASPDEQATYLGKLAKGFSPEPFLSAIGDAGVGLNSKRASSPEDFETRYQPLVLLAGELRAAVHAEEGGRMVSEVLADIRARREHIRRSVHDPVDQAQMLSIMTGMLHFELGVPKVTERMVRDTVKDLVLEQTAGGADSDLRILAAQKPESVVAARANGILLSLYPYITPDPQLTSHLAGGFSQAYEQLAMDRGYRGAEAAFVAGVTLLRNTTSSDHSSFMRNIDAMADTFARVSLMRELTSRIIHSEQDAQAILHRFGLDDAVLRKAWIEASTEDDPLPAQGRAVSDYRYHADNIEAILKLEGISPGICTALQEVLHIRNFTRYPEDTLLRAAAMLDNPPASYVVYAVAAKDRYAFSNLRYFVRHLEEELSESGMQLLPMEMASLATPTLVADALAQRGWRRASHVIVNVHGHPDGIHPGPRPEHEISSEMLGIAGVAAFLRQIIDRNGTFVLNSCSTGRNGEQSFAANLRDATGNRVLAPEVNDRLGTFSLARDAVTGQLRPVVSYSLGNVVEFLPKEKGIS
jgi:hypothetical protein